MKTIMYYVPKVIKKLFALILSLTLRLFTFVYRVASFFVSLACIGVVVMGILGAIAELIFAGANEAVLTYFALAVAGYALRCIVLGVLPFLLKLQAYVDAKAHAPIRETAYYGDCYYTDFYDDCCDDFCYDGYYSYN